MIYIFVSDIYLYSNLSPIRQHAIAQIVMCVCVCVRREKSFRSLIKSDRYQIVLTIFRLFWNQNDVRFGQSNQSENGQYNLISV